MGAPKTLPPNFFEAQAPPPELPPNFFEEDPPPQGPSTGQRFLEAVEGYSPLTSAAVKAGRGLYRGAKDIASIPGQLYEMAAEGSRVSADPEATRGQKIAAAARSSPPGIATQLLIEPQIEQAREAGRQFGEGSIARGLFHTGAAAVPIAGPIAAQVLEDVESPELGRFGAAGRVGAYALTPKVARGAGAAGRTALRPAMVVAEPLAGRVLNSVIRPHLRDFQFGKNPGAAVAKEGLTANTAEGLLTKISNRVEKVGVEIDKTLAQKGAGKTVNVQQIIDDVTSGAEKLARQGGNPNLAEQVGKLRDALLQEWTGKKPAQMSVQDATMLKRALGKNTRWAGGDATAMQLNDIRRQLYGRIRTEIDQKVPEVRGLNERYGNLLTAEKSLDHAIKTGERQGLVPLKDMIFGGGGAIAGGLPGAIAGYALSRALKSPATLTRMGAVLAKAAKGGKKPLRPSFQRSRTLVPAAITAALASKKED